MERRIQKSIFYKHEIDGIDILAVFFRYEYIKMAYVEKKYSFQSTQFWLDQISADIYFSFVFFSSIPNYLMFGVSPLLCFKIILIVFSLLICY